MPGHSPQEILEPGEQNGQIKRLGEIIVRAGGEPAQYIFGTSSRGQHQYRDIALMLAQLGEHLKAVFAGKHDIEQHGIEVAAVSSSIEQEFQRGGPVSGDAGSITLGLQVKE